MIHKIPKYRKSFYGYDSMGFQETRKKDKDGFSWRNLIVE